ALALSGLVLAMTAWVAFFGLDNHDRQNDEFLAVMGSRLIGGDPLHGLFGATYGDRGPERLAAVLLWIAQGWPGGTAADLQAGRVLFALAGGLTALPVYGLARGLGLERPVAVATAAAAVVTPWAVFGTTYLNTVLGVGTTTLLVLCMWRALVHPSRWADAAVVAATALAATARVSQAAFVLAFVPALLAVGWRERPDGTAATAWARRLPVHLVHRHPVLAGVGIAGLLAVLARGQDGVLGGYGSQITSQDLEPGRLADQAFEILARLAPAAGVVLAGLALAWIARELVRPRSLAATAYAWLCTGLVGVFLYIYFTAQLEDRYVAPLLPLAVVAAARAIAHAEVSPLGALVGGVVAARAVAVAGSPTNDFPYAGFIDASALFLRRVVVGRLDGAVGGASLTAVLLALVAAAVTLAIAARHPRVPRRVLATAALGATCLWGAVAGSYAMDFYVDGAGRPELAWSDLTAVDATVGDEPVWIMGTPLPTPDLYQRMIETSYFNGTVRGTLVLLDEQQRAYCCQPRPVRNVLFTVDERTGAVRVRRGAPPRWYVMPTGYQRLVLDGRRVRATPSGMVLVRREDGAPLRLTLVVAAGDHGDGWARPGRALRVRTFPAAGPRQCLRGQVAAPPPAPDAGPRPATRWSARLRGRLVQSGSLQPDHRAELDIALPRRGTAEITLRGAPDLALADGRRTGLRADDLRVEDC
ncbi:MAG TPA: hypothetical protein VD931_01050, partial [Baekduia sp.]|nr:hypothetical protein [Baekduia sp.]